MRARESEIPLAPFGCQKTRPPPASCWIEKSLRFFPIKRWSRRFASFWIRSCSASCSLSHRSHPRTAQHRSRQDTAALPITRKTRRVKPNST